MWLYLSTVRGTGQQRDAVLLHKLPELRKPDTPEIPFLASAAERRKKMKKVRKGFDDEDALGSAGPQHCACPIA